MIEKQWQLVSKLNTLCEAFGEVFQCIDEIEDEKIINGFAENYPFHRSFDEIALEVEAWSESITKLVRENYIETFNTGSNWYMAQQVKDNKLYTVSNVYSKCLTCYNYKENSSYCDYFDEDMIFSKTVDELSEDEMEMYKKLHEQLAKDFPNLIYEE